MTKLILFCLTGLLACSPAKHFMQQQKEVHEIENNIKEAQALTHDTTTFATGLPVVYSDTARTFETDSTKTVERVYTNHYYTRIDTVKIVSTDVMQLIDLQSKVSQQSALYEASEAFRVKQAKWVYWLTGYAFFLMFVLGISIAFKFKL